MKRLPVGKRVGNEVRNEVGEGCQVEIEKIRLMLGPAMAIIKWMKRRDHAGAYHHLSSILVIV